MQTRTFIRHAHEGNYEQTAPGVFVRDLGVGEVTGGDFALKIVHLEAEGARREKLRRHDEGFSLAFVLEGWLDVEFEDLGKKHLLPGTVVPAFNGPTHREVSAGDNLQVLVLVTPKKMSGSERAKVVVLPPPTDADYKTGLRDYYRYRDFDLPELTGGRMTAHVIKAVPGRPADSKWHAHDVQFQMVYVLEGWVEFDYADIGKVRLEKGALACQAPGIGHIELRHSDDLLMIEIATPADFGTRLVDAPTSPSPQ